MSSDGPKFCPGCERITQMVLRAGISMMQCPMCGWIVRYPTPGQVWGKDNRSEPSFTPAGGWEAKSNDQV